MQAESEKPSAIRPLHDEAMFVLCKGAIAEGPFIFLQMLKGLCHCNFDIMRPVNTSRHLTGGFSLQGTCAARTGRKHIMDRTHKTIWHFAKSRFGIGIVCGEFQDSSASGLGSPRKTRRWSLSGSGEFVRLCTLYTFPWQPKWIKMGHFFSFRIPCFLLVLVNQIRLACQMKHDLLGGGKRTRSRRFCSAFAAARRGNTIKFWYSSAGIFDIQWYHV